MVDPSRARPDRFDALRLKGSLLRPCQILVRLLRFAVEPRVFQGDARLVGKGFCKANFLLVEDTALSIADPNGADHALADDKRQSKNSSPRGLFDPAA